VSNRSPIQLDFWHGPGSAGGGAALSLEFDTRIAVLPTGIDGPQFGTALVYRNIVVTGAGASSFAAFGTATLVIRQYIGGGTGAGLQELYGDATVFNKNRYLQASGLDAALFGLAIVSPLYVLPSGSSFVGLGNPTLTNLNRTLPATGALFDQWGRPSVTNLTRRITATIASATQYGRPRISNYSRSISPRGFDASSGYGTPWVTNRNRTIIVRPDLPLTEYGRKNTTNPLLSTWVSNYTRYVQPSSNDTFPAFGRKNNRDAHASTWVSNWIRYLTPRGRVLGVVWYDFGPVDRTSGTAARVYLKNRTLKPARVPGPYFGTAFIQGGVYGIGFDTAQFGLPLAYSDLLAIGGDDFLDIGRPTVTT
jgi:hypothetical protein